VEPLRWILLAAGFVFVIVIYILGRNRRQRHSSIADEQEDNLPEFSARNLDNVDEGVGEVRIITGVDSISEIDTDLDALKDDGSSTYELTDNDQFEELSEDEVSTKSGKPSDIIVLYILSKPNQSLIGSQINSSAQAMGLSFGEMNIFHYKKDNRNIFSLANMIEPGSFDPATIHDLKTSGLTVFMQIQGDDPLDDLTEMLQRSYQLAGLLDARLCNNKREPLTEQDAENYRTQVSEYIESKTAELSGEI